MTHVLGHRGHPENEACDRMAVAAYKDLMRGVRGIGVSKDLIGERHRGVGGAGTARNQVRLGGPDPMLLASPCRARRTSSTLQAELLAPSLDQLC